MDEIFHCRRGLALEITIARKRSHSQSGRCDLVAPSSDRPELSRFEPAPSQARGLKHRAGKMSNVECRIV